MKNLANQTLCVVGEHRRDVAVFLCFDVGGGLVCPLHIGKQALGSKFHPAYPSCGRGGLAVGFLMQGLMLVIHHQLRARLVGQLRHIMAVGFGEIPSRHVKRPAVYGAEFAVRQKLDAPVLRRDFKFGGRHHPFHVVLSLVFADVGIVGQTAKQAGDAGFRPRMKKARNGVRAERRERVSG